MKRIIAIGALILTIAAVGVGATGDKAPRQVRYLNFRDTQNGDRPWVQAPSVVVLENGPGWVRYRYANGQEMYYSGDYLIAY